MFLKTMITLLMQVTYVLKLCYQLMTIGLLSVFIVFKYKHYDKWKKTDAVETMVYFLDAIITEFLEKLENYRNSNSKDDQQTFLFMERAYNLLKKIEHLV